MLKLCSRRAKARHPLLLLAALGSPLLGAPAVAGSFQIDPVKVEVSSDRKTGSVTIRNDASAPVTVRGYALGWTQKDGEDVYSDLPDVIVSPPVFTIPAGGKQVVRVGLRSAAAPSSYRLILEEVPAANSGSGIQVALRLNLPLYILEKAGSAGDLAWSAVQQADRSWQLEAVNRGTGYVQVDTAEARRQTGISLPATMWLGAVLPGSSRRWTIGKAPNVIDRARFEQVARAHDNDGVQLAAKH
jgi:fimbrial chaperone protein